MSVLSGAGAFRPRGYCTSPRAWPSRKARPAPSLPVAPPSRYSPLLGDGARLLRGGSGRGRRRGSRRGSPRFALIGTQRLPGPAQQMARENPQPPPRAVPLRVPVHCGTGARARARLACCSRRLRHGFRLVPPSGTAGRG